MLGGWRGAGGARRLRGARLLARPRRRRQPRRHGARPARRSTADDGADPVADFFDLAAAEELSDGRPAAPPLAELGAGRLARAEPRLRSALIAGALLQGPAAGPPGPALWHYARALPDPYRHDLGRALRASRRDWIGPREALRGQRAALAAALTAEPFDAAAVAGVLRSRRALTGDLAARGATLLVDADRADVAGRARRLRRGAAEDRRGRDGRRH